MPTKRPQRIERRAERVMGRAQKNYGKYEALRKSIGDREMTDNEATYADKLERRVARQETRAKNLKNKAQYVADKNEVKRLAARRTKTVSEDKNIDGTSTRAKYKMKWSKDGSLDKSKVKKKTYDSMGKRINTTVTKNTYDSSGKTTSSKVRVRKK